MTPVLVDANVILDIFTEDPTWYAWSSSAVERLADDRMLAVNPVIYSEVSIRFESVEELESVLPSDVFVRLPIPWEAAFLAGKCFLAYRRRGGKRRSTLPDFFVGAHAAVSGLTLLTRDSKRYRTYFPGLDIVSPA